MSLIRSLNNPEGLYVWADGDNMNFMQGEDNFPIPLLHFRKLMAKLVKLDRYEGLPYEKLTVGNVISIEEFDYSKVRITYQNKSIEMWGVTWFYIYNSWVRCLT
jgi:hypothetical protein